jgi:hypothetical protein
MTSPFILLLISLSATEILINGVETLAELGYVLIGGIRDAISCCEAILHQRTVRHLLAEAEILERHRWLRSP